MVLLVQYNFSYAHKLQNIDELLLICINRSLWLYLTNAINNRHLHSVFSVASAGSSTAPAAEDNFSQIHFDHRY